MAYAKYHNKPTVVDGIKFPSQREAQYYTDLKKLEKSGKIKELKLQPKFPLLIDDKRPVLMRSDGYPNGRQAYYKADFMYVDTASGKRHVVDVKGVSTPVFKLKRALVEAIYGIEIEIVK